jgi:HlyD family secretion protein
VLARLIEPGQTVTAGFQTPVLFKLAEDLTRMRLHVLVDEADVGRVTAGQKATFTVEAYPDQTFDSQVESIRYEPTTDQNVVTYEAVLKVDNKKLLLRPGMTATANIVAETKRNVILVPNAALRFAPPLKSSGGPPDKDANKGLNAGAGPRVWVQRGPEPTAISVKPGATDGRYTELVHGDLQPGTKVLTDVVAPP